MANILVSYSEIEQAATQLGAGRDEIQHKLRVLHGQIDSLVGSGFVTDQASGRFAQSYAEYTASASAVVDRLTEIQGFLTHTASALRDVDQQIAAQIR